MLKRLPIVLVAGVYSAVVATAISATVLTLYFVLAGDSPIGLGSGIRYVVVSARLCAATAPYALSFGLLGGGLLGAWLTFRAASYHSKTHLLGECVILGTLLSLTFPVFHGQMNRSVLAMWRTGLIPEGLVRYILAWPVFLNGSREPVFAIAVGVPCALLVGIVFGSRVRRQVNPPSITAGESA